MSELLTKNEKKDIVIIALYIQEFHAFKFNFKFHAHFLIPSE